MIGHDCCLVEKSGELKAKYVGNESDLYKGVVLRRKMVLKNKQIGKFQ